MAIDTSGLPALQLHWLSEQSTGPAVAAVRGDRLGGMVSGNKWFKLQGYFSALESSPRKPWLVSPGGAWSNHLHALAAAGQQRGFPTLGIVRGERASVLSDTLEDAQAWGMRLHFVSRALYRQRHESGWLEARAREAFQTLDLAIDSPVVEVPEGGSGPLAFEGLALWAGQMLAAFPKPDVVIVPVGSGGTLAGLCAALPPNCRVEGIACARDNSLPGRIRGLLEAQGCGAKRHASWILLEGYEGPGFGRLDSMQEQAARTLEQEWALPLDPVYTAKLVLAFQQRWRAGVYRGQRVLLVHTGGLQGRRGFGWPAVEKFTAQSGILR